MLFVECKVLLRSKKTEIKSNIFDLIRWTPRVIKATLRYRITLSFFISNFTYFIPRLTKMKFKKYYSAAQEAHRASGKNTILLMIDMMMCSFQYSIGYTEYNEFE